MNGAIWQVPSHPGYPRVGQSRLIKPARSRASVTYDKTGLVAINVFRSSSGFGEDDFGTVDFGADDRAGLSGTDAHEASRTGSVISARVAAGSSAKVSGSKAGLVISGFVASGADVNTFSKAGSAISDAVAKGADEATHSKTGAVISTCVLSGDDSPLFNKAGSVISEAVVSGGRTTAIGGKGGTVTAGSQVSGTSATTYDRTGTATGVRILSSANDAHTSNRKAIVIAVGVLKGSTQAVMGGLPGLQVPSDIDVSYSVNGYDPDKRYKVIVPDSLDDEYKVLVEE